VDADSDLLPAALNPPGEQEIDHAFRENYARIARVIARVIGNRGRAEELAVEAFLRWWHRTGARGQGAGKWLYRVAVRIAIDELRRETRRARSERLMTSSAQPVDTPEDVERSSQTRRRVRIVLSTLSRRNAALLILRSEGLTYQDVAAALGLNPASVGTLISRAQRAFRDEYVRRYESPV
jgi:RNA polymerase sigma-70 factor (ECF subfamily)